MAALVERPMSVLYDQVIPQRRRRESSPPRGVEIIDVDEWDDDIPILARPTQRRRTDDVEVVVLSSDDEDDFLPLPVPSSSRTRLRSPALATRAPSPVPPVPPVPSHLASYNSFPMRRNPPVHPGTPHRVPPPLRPLEHEYDFEHSLSGPGSPGLTATEIRRRTSHTPGPSGSSGSRHPRNAPSGSGSGTRAAPPTIHADNHRAPPAMGLGGGLISFNNFRLAQERAERDRRAQARAAGGSTTHRHRSNGNGGGTRRAGRGNAFHFIGPRDVFLDDEEYLLHLMLGEADREIMHHFGAGPLAFTTLGMHNKKPEPDYEMAYTHPPKPDPGFTFDFAPGDEESAEVNLKGDGESSSFPVTSIDNPIILDDDEPSTSTQASSSSSSSSSSVPAFKFKALLTCSHCRDPLILGEGTIGLSETEARRRKIWSLRCGHLIDGKCYEELAFPKPEPVPEPVPGDEVGISTRKDKGKGKAVDLPMTTTSPQDDSSNSIRSRLRPRHGTNATSSSNSNSSAADANNGNDGWLGSFRIYLGGGRGRSTNTTGRGGRKGKGKEKEKLPRLEATFQWACPVPGCGREHESAKMDGVWGVDKESGRGAVQVFV
ncbi:hypothetical protein VKT23_008238 [Stygiomarasmius scandens]|uniref:Uncharacterized protein n=1 Tax=Marasmiellus scandens TaxID=2682957 RepID=A0ABR1JIH3_9AGAR